MGRESEGATLLRYAVIAWARMLDVALKMAAWIVAFTIGEGIM